jgi:hypothetical protein
MTDDPNGRAVKGVIQQALVCCELCVLCVLLC